MTSLNVGIAIATCVVLVIFLGTWLWVNHRHVYGRYLGLSLCLIAAIVYGRLLGLSWFSWFPLPVQ